MLNSFYQDAAIAPNLGNAGVWVASPDIFRMGGHIRWGEVKGADRFAVYRLEETAEKTAEGGVVWRAVLKDTFHGFIYKCKESGNYIVLSCKGGSHSERSNVIYVKVK